MKKAIAAVVLAALVLAAFAVLPQPYVRAQASQARVLTYSWYTAPSNTILAQAPGDLVVVGEIQNVGSSIIQNATVGGTAYSASGQTLASAEGQAYVFETTPGQKAPFSIDFTPSSSTSQNSNWIPSVARITVTVLSVTDTSASPYPNLTIPHQAVYGFNDGGNYTVVGTIVNNGTQTIGPVWVVTTFYNASLTVVGLNFTDYLVTSFAPGDATRWVAIPADNTAQLSNSITSFSYQIDSLPSASYITQPTLTPTAPPATPSKLPVLPIVVVVVIVVVAVAALMLLRKRQKPPPPPPPPPPPSML